ncbi:hypothetical protein NBO_1103g0002 [Nosema bombycis CQ1]|uniref:Uncharacterized protein n=1 Tax=Nosema bombycis (strain CQ1 / CVCC 102059) TaxID=578461 RepID=R0KN11_NOSB1|nr:hypothetical protein NBO_1103g0002 [Nosema bombycis CQ1]|eukprot:EOB11527.1 hypothetical protein NBO_1103g0002 [Nosema bombycis CQ1]
MRVLFYKLIFFCDFMRIKKISKQKSKIKSKNKSKNESKTVEDSKEDKKTMEDLKEESDHNSQENLETNNNSEIIDISKFKNKPKIKPKMTKSKQQEPGKMDFLKSELNNIIREEDEKNKKNPIAFKKLKEKEFIKVMASIANSIKEIEIDITRAVNLIKEIFDEPEGKSENRKEGTSKGDSNKVKESRGVKGDKKAKESKGVKESKGDCNKPKGDTKAGPKKDKNTDVNTNKLTKKDVKPITESMKDISIQDSLINPSIIQHSDPSHISFSGESYSIEKIIRKLKDKYKNNQFSSSMARSGMFTSSKRPKKDEWDAFLENLAEKNVLKKTNGRPVKYKF